MQNALNFDVQYVQYTRKADLVQHIFIEIIETLITLNRDLESTITDDTTVLNSFVKFNFRERGIK